MGAEETIGYKIIDYVFAALVLVAIVTAISIIFSSEVHDQLAASREIALMRDTSLMAPYQLSNASFSINEEYLLKLDEQNKKITVVREDKSISQEINGNSLASKTEIIIPPRPNDIQIMQKGWYRINVNV
jgi:hypothetical protein